MYYAITNRKVQSAIRKKPIAVVDDDASVRKSLNRLFRSAGIEAVAFASAKDFLKALPTLGPACLVLDVHMPGMDGIALQAELAKRESKVPIVFITAHDDQKIREKAFDAGAADFLAKPFDYANLIEVVEAAMISDVVGRND